MSGMSGTFRSIWRFHRLLAGILVLEYAATFAILLSAVSIAHARARTFAFESGINESGLYVVRPETVTGALHASDVDDAVEAFRAATPDVAVGSAVPFLGAADESGNVDTGGPGEVRVSVYRGGTNFADTLGVEIRHGRPFLPDEAGSRQFSAGPPSVAILSEPLARRLFHADSAVGKTVFLNGSALVVVGVCAPLAAPQFRGRPETAYTLILPGAPASAAARVILVRAEQGEALLRRLLDKVNAASSGRIVWSMQSYEHVRSNYFKADRAVALGLTATVLAVVLTSLCGVLGLTRYWIGRRQTQIAVRRALGATRVDILGHFIAESSWLMGFGLLLGGTAAVMAGQWTGLLHGDGLDLASLSVSLVLTFGLSIAAVHASLHGLLRLQPIELVRRPGN